MSKTKEVGRRYTRRVQLAPGVEPINPEVHHIFSGATGRYKTWAVENLEAKGISASAIIADAASEGWINEGAVLREHVSCVVGTEPDDVVSLAARIYELCRLVEVFMASPEVMRPGAGIQAVFELGRTTMLARVYGIDESSVAKRTSSMLRSIRKYTNEDKNKWQEMRNANFLRHTKRDAARLIAGRLGLPEEAAETIRRSIT